MEAIKKAYDIDDYIEDNYDRNSDDVDMIDNENPAQYDDGFKNIEEDVKIDQGKLIEYSCHYHKKILKANKFLRSMHEIMGIL